MALGELFKEFIENNELAKQFCDFMSKKIEKINAKIEEYQKDFSSLTEIKKEAEKFLDDITGKTDKSEESVLTEVQADVNNNNLKGDNMEEEEVKTEEVKTDEVKTEEAKTDEVKTDEVKTEEVKTEEVKTDEVKTGEHVEPTVDDVTMLGDVAAGGEL